MPNSSYLAAHLRSQLGPRWSMDSPYQWGKVTGVHAGPPATLDVQIEGGTTVTGLRYLSTGATYSGGDVVVVARMVGKTQSARFVIGKLA